jgi:primary-amine oxidase
MESCCTPKTIQSFAHPLDPLSEDEIAKAGDVLRKLKSLGDSIRFAFVQLEEPAKADVLKWKVGDAVHRAARLIVFDGKTGATHTAIVSLTKGKMISFVEHPTKTHPYGQPPIIMEDFFKTAEIVKADAGWLNAMRRRGLTDAEIALVQVDPFSAGFFDREVERGRRLVSAVSYWREAEKDNAYAHPIDGVVALVDLIEGKVVDLVDEEETIPIPKTKRNYNRESWPDTRKDIKPLDIVQREGPSFKVDGWQVDWQKWNFRIGFTPREGLVLHQLSYNDKGQNARSSIAPASQRWSCLTQILPPITIGRAPLMLANMGSANSPTRWSLAAIVWDISTILMWRPATMSASPL